MTRKFFEWIKKTWILFVAWLSIDTESSHFYLHFWVRYEKEKHLQDPNLIIETKKKRICKQKFCFF